MSNKLRFQIIYYTGQDDNYPATELNQHSSDSRGYLTSKYCEYPQELILKLLDGKARITKMQILSHENKISQKIIFYHAIESTLETCQFIKIGHVKLSSNENSGYKARELKTVHIDHEATFVKLEITGCFPNKHNIYNQSGIVAINILGDIIENDDIDLPTDQEFITDGLLENSTIMKESNSTESLLKINMESKQKILNPIDDPSFDMRFDPVMASKLKEVYLAKEKAIQLEDYDQAKRLKIVEDQIKNVGIQLARLEIQKKNAINNEDYDTAKHIKKEMDEIQSKIDYESIGLSRGPTVATVTNIFNTNFSLKSNNKVENDDIYMNSPIVPPSKFTSGLNVPPAAIGYAPLTQGTPHKPSEKILHKEETPIIQRSQDLHIPVQPNDTNSHESAANVFADIPGYESLEDPEDLPQGLRKESEEMIEVIGEYLTKCFYSSLWSHRDGLIKKFTNNIYNYESTPEKVFRVGCSITEMGIHDKKIQISSSAFELVKTLVDFGHSFTPKEISLGLEKPVSALLGKLGEGKPTSKDHAGSILIYMASKRHIGCSFISFRLLQPTKRPLNPKLLSGRLQILQELIDEFGLSKESGMSIENLISFMKETNSFSHPNAEVRESAKALCTHLYLIAGLSIDKYLEPHLRPKQLEEYRAAFEKLKVKSENKTSKDNNNNNNNTEDSDEKEILNESETDAPADQCQFCSYKDPSFVNDSFADRHYYNDCVMLAECQNCGQIIEIQELNMHLLAECEMKGNNKECPRCGEAINGEYFESHTKRNDCPKRNNLKEANRCPLCHLDIQPGEEGWIQHLKIEKCPFNVRTNQGDNA